MGYTECVGVLWAGTRRAGGGGEVARLGRGGGEGAPLEERAVGEQRAVEPRAVRCACGEG